MVGRPCTCRCRVFTKVNLEYYVLLLGIYVYMYHRESKPSTYIAMCMFSFYLHGRSSISAPTLSENCVHAVSQLLAQRRIQSLVPFIACSLVRPAKLFLNSACLFMYCTLQQTALYMSMHELVSLLKQV